MESHDKCNDCSHDDLKPVENGRFSNSKSEDYSHLKEVCSAFANYHVDTLRDVTRIERDFISISEKYGDYLTFNWQDRINRIKTCSQMNYLFLLRVIQEYAHMFQFKRDDKSKMIYIEPLDVLSKNISKLRSTIKLLVRDWADEGKQERENCHFRLINELLRYYNPKENQNEAKYKVVVPGAGLGRIVFELCKAGFSAQGNEFSYFMLLTSNYILNNTYKKNQISVYPYIHNFNNLLEENDAFKEIKIPDINLMEELQSNSSNKNNNITDKDGSDNDEISFCCDGEMSMVAGEFIEVYKKQYNTYESVLTSYFIDTAHNVIEYIETIYNILKPGGVWINFGPLLYHYSDMLEEKSIELPLSEIKRILENKFKFEILKWEMHKASYIGNEMSMINTVYNCVFFTVRKINKLT